MSSVGLNYSHFDDIMKAFTQNGCTCLVDAENYLIQDTIDLHTNKAIVNKSSSNNIFKTYQMYRKDSMDHLMEDIEMFRALG